MNVNKTAATDATRWLAAEMAYGQGAGTRRKLLDAEITQKMVDLGPKYADKFYAAYEKLDQNKFAKAAIKERRRLDHTSYIAKNARALVRGDVRHVSPSLLLIAGVAYYAHVTGYDKKIWEQAKVEYRSAKFQAKMRWEQHRKHNESIKQFIDIDKPYGGQ